MKAIKKAYGKAKWIDTRHSRHYFKAITSARIDYNIKSSSLAAAGSVTYNGILHKPSDCINEKRLELSECVLNLGEGLADLLKEYNSQIKQICKQYGVISK